MEKVNLNETTTQAMRWQRSATLLAFALATTAEYWTSASVSLTLTDLGGTLAASSDEATWALTIYTTAFAVAIALSHRLSVYFGNRKYLGVCALTYAIASTGCALSPNLPSFLVFRAVQGFAGGIFLVRTFVFFTQRIELEHRASIALTFFIEVMIFGRLIPYIASGWFADNVTWRLQFAIPTILMLAAASLFFTFTAKHWRQADNTGEPVDLLGVVLLVVGAGALQTALSRGEIDDWFGSFFIRTFFAIGIVGNALFALWELSPRNKAPLLDLRYMRERTIYAGGVVGFALGLLLSGSLYVIPQFLRTVESHSALQTGVLLSVGAVGAIFSLWLLQYIQPLTKRLGSRFILSAGFLTAMISELLFAHFLTPDTPDYLLWIPLFLNGVFIALSVPTLGGAAFALVTDQETSSARAIFYGLRQFGTSVGVTVAVILVDRRSALHSGRLLEAFFNRSLAPISQTQEFSAEALKTFEALIRKQSLVLAFSDVFYVMAAIAALSLLTIPLLPVPNPGRAASHADEKSTSPKNLEAISAETSSPHRHTDNAVPNFLANRSALTGDLSVRTKGALSMNEMSVADNLDFAIVAHSVDVNRPIDETWCKVGDFADAGRFLNVPSKLVSGNGQIGSVRIVGDSILEVMVGSSRYSYTYAQVHGPMAALWYHGCLKLSSLGPKSCRLTYTLIYDQTTLDGARRSSEFERITLRFQSAAQAMKIAAEASREHEPKNSS